MTLMQQLGQYGLHLRGVIRLGSAEIAQYGFDPRLTELALVGNIGSSYWPSFSTAAEFDDGKADPLDRWSRRVAALIAEAHDLVPVFPFDGPPYYPFQQWAARAEGLLQSPVGVMMHPQHGLWHSYRFALLGNGFEFELPPATESPCLGCTDQPCLATCPVDAFDQQGYDHERCTDYLNETPQAECHGMGCLARLACPVAPQLRYLPAQGRFHLQAFLRARVKA